MHIMFLVLTQNDQFNHFGTRTYENRSLAATEIVHMFTQLIKLDTFYYHILKSADPSII